MSGNRTWTAVEDALLKRLYRQRLSWLAISAVLERAPGAVKARIARLRVRR